MVLNKGIFISFEGIDRCGKSTQVEKLTLQLQEDGYPVLTLRDPGGSEISEQIRKILLSIHNMHIDPITELLLYEAARAQIVAEKIRPALQKKMIVLIDRFYDSTTAYQGYGRGLDLQAIEKANMLATGGLVPDLTIFIDINWEEAERRRGRSAHDRMESEDQYFFERIRNGYIQIVQENAKRVKLIDGNLSIESIGEKIYHEVTRVIRKHSPIHSN